MCGALSVRQWIDPRLRLIAKHISDQEAILNPALRGDNSIFALWIKVFLGEGEENNKTC